MVFASTNSLKRSNTKSCGCLQKEKAALNGKISATTHGLSKGKNGKKTRLFRIWIGIKTRCYNPNVVEFPRYGGKGVVLCDQWKNYESFHEWSYSNGYRDDLSIDRVNVSGNYEPTNCRWVDSKTQCRNRTSSRFLTFNGQTKTLSEFSEIYGLSQQVLHGRLKRGWSLENALNKPLNNK